MNRVFRRAFRIVCLILLALLLSLWLRAGIAHDVVSYTTARGTYWEIITIAGQLRITTVANWPEHVPLFWNHGRMPVQPIVFGHRPIYGHQLTLGIARVSGPAMTWTRHNRAATFSRFDTLALPIPVMVMMAWLPWLAAVLAYSRRSQLKLQRRLAGLCVECGYDIRNCHECCSECGAPLPATRLLA